ncbi:MAG: GNAT family N-acetyltransferase [Bacteroidaceae bacterium]|nr:GNAT family N-acetyltransferase [Bacteroidaceae bacterium]
MHIDIYTKSEELPTLLPGSILHSAEMFHMLCKNSSTSPYMMVATEGGCEVAHIIIIKRRGIKLLPPVAGSWFTIYGEGVYSQDCHNKEEVFSLFVEKLFDIFDIFKSYIEIKGIMDARFAYATLSKHNFIPVRDHRIYISLHSKAPEERLSRNYRTHLRKSRERGTTYREAATPQEKEEGLRLLKNYYKTKIRRPLPPNDIMQGLLAEERQKMFIVENGGKIIGCSVCTYHNDTAYLIFSCGLRKSHPLLYPGIVAVWAAIEHAHKSGYAHIEFLESRTLIGIRSGYKNFLLNFGGKQVSTLRWYHFKWGFINKILRAIYV